MRKYFFLFPGALAFLIAVSQFFLVKYKHLSEWKLAGFGMFSVHDERLVVMTAETVNGKKEITYDPRQSETGREVFNNYYLKNLEIYPSKKHFDRLKEMILGARFVDYGRNLRYIPSDYALFQNQGNSVRVIPQSEERNYHGKNIIKKLQLAVWKKEYNQEKKKKEYRLIAKEIYAF